MTTCRIPEQGGFARFTNQPHSLPSLPRTTSLSPYELLLVRRVASPPPSLDLLRRVRDGLKRLLADAPAG
jgi:hypothetical protein